MILTRRLLLAVTAVVPLLASLSATAKGGISGGGNMGMSRSISVPSVAPKISSPATSSAANRAVVPSAPLSSSTSRAPSTGFGERPAQAVPVPVAPSAPAVAAKPLFSKPTSSFFEQKPATPYAPEISVIWRALGEIADSVMLVLRVYNRSLVEVGFSCAPSSALQTASDWQQDCQTNDASLSHVFTLKMRRNCTPRFGETAHRWAERCAGVTPAQLTVQAQAGRGYSQGW